MPDQDPATLRDSMVTDPPAEPKPEVKSDSEIKVPELDGGNSPEALEMAKILAGSGVSPDQLNDLLTAPKILESLRYQWQEDPKAFVQMLERTDPKVGEHFVKEVSDLFLDRNKHLIDSDQSKPNGKDDKSDSSELARQVQQLQEQTSRLQAQEQQRNQAASLAAVRQRYEARVDDALGQAKEMNLSPSEVKNLRARLWTEINSDSSAAQRANAGNFVDIPRVLQGLLQEKVADRKAAVATAEGDRKRVQSNSFWDFPSGPDGIVGDLNKIIADDNDPNWGGTIEGFAKALERTR
jgi:hypothetical protein